MKTVFKSLHLASTYNCSSLKDKIVEFILKEENFKTIVKNTEWNEFALQEQAFANEVLSAVLEKLTITSK